jgi:hypothetical protein
MTGTEIFVQLDPANLFVTENLDLIGFAKIMRRIISADNGFIVSLSK